MEIGGKFLILEPKSENYKKNMYRAHSEQLHLEGLASADSLLDLWSSNSALDIPSLDPDMEANDDDDLLKNKRRGPVGGRLM
jgi:hypothetical protein